jgi:hypothetical protein
MEIYRQDIQSLDTPSLRELYCALQKTGIRMYGGEMTPKTFNTIVAEELEAGGFNATPRNWVYAAQSVVDMLVEEELYSTQRRQEEGL